MGKFLLLVLGVALLLALGVTSAAAMPTDDLVSLAQYYPDDTAVFFSIRTDDAFIDELDDLMALIGGNLPEGSQPTTTLRETLDQAVQQQYGLNASFDTTIRSWLGDTAAIGAINFDNTFDDDYSNDYQTPVLVAISITDRDAAETFFDDLAEDSNLELKRDAARGWTVYSCGEQSYCNSFWAIGDEAVLFGTTEAVLGLDGDFAPLSEGEIFTQTVGMLPASEYNAILALNLRETMSHVYARMITQMKAYGGGDLATFQALQPIYENYPSQAIGFALMDDRSLVMDAAQTAFDFSALEGTWLGGLTPPMNQTPIDYDYARYVPADAPFYFQGTNFGGYFNYMIDAMGIGFDLGMQQYMDSMMQYGSTYGADVPAFLTEMDGDDLRAWIDLSFAGFTGLNLEEDVLPYLNGNSLFYMRALESSSLPLTVDATTVFEVTDADATQAMYDSFVDALDRYDASYAESDGMLEIPGLIRGLFPVRAQDRLQDPQLDFLVGLTDDVLVFGTRPGVEFSVNPAQADSIAADEAYQAASEYFLDDAQALFYLNMQPVRSIVAMVNDVSGYQMSDDENAILELFDSASVSTVIHDDFSTVARLVVTLSD